MGSLNNRMSLMNVPIFYQNTARGVVLMLAVALIISVERALPEMRRSLSPRTFSLGLWCKRQDLARHDVGPVSLSASVHQHAHTRQMTT
jgi:hypothetical protein